MKTHFQFNNCIKHFALLDPYNVMYVCMLFGELGAGTAFVGGLLLATSAGVIRDHIKSIYIYRTQLKASYCGIFTKALASIRSCDVTSK